MPTLDSRRNEATELANAHGKLSCAARFASPRREQKALEARTLGVLAELHEGDPATVRQLPHAHWLLDNGHMLRATLLEIRKDLPPGYYRQLPMIARGGARHCRPRIADLVESAVTSGELPLDLNRFERFCNLYQRVAPLTIGELWALPTFLRMWLLTQICSIAEKASALAESEASAVELDELTSRLSSAITSLRNVAAFRWETFVQHTSTVDRILQRDPAGVFERVDVATRNDYRSKVERIARKANLPESKIAETALALARAAAKESGPQCASHAGYYLVDQGTDALYAKLGMHRHPLVRSLSPESPARAVLYLSSLVAPTLALCVALAMWLGGAGTPPGWLVATTLIAVIPALMLSSTLVNRVLAFARGPRRMPKLDFAKGIPETHRAVIAVPAMLSNRTAIDDNLHTLELNYLGNDDRGLQFVLLSDYADAKSEECPDDAALLEHAIAGIDRLNKRYSKNGATPFVLLHRRRRFNARDNRWMGRERKRGKLAEFNEFLRGAGDTDFTVQHGALRQPQKIRYVVTLDADTFLPPGVARELAATLAHPLNRPEIGDDGRVKRGYSILQPRVETNPASSSATPFARLYAGDVTLDLYTHTVSNVYQDLFAHGIFAGKGIYDVDAFREAIQPHLPNNRVLSHDLLEGLYGRAGLVTDIVLLEDYPSSLAEHLKRIHRWIRGDWQLLPWLLGRPPEREPASFRPGIIGRWQLFDNLARSLLMPAILCLFSLGWLVLPVNPWAMTAIVMVTPGIGVLLHAITVFRLKSWRWGTLHSSFSQILSHSGRDLCHWLLVLAFLPLEALVALDALTRTLYRVGVSKRKLLEWTTAADVARSLGEQRQHSNYWRRMWPAPAWAGANLLAIAYLLPASLPAAAVMLLLWVAAPGIGARVSRKRAPAEPQLAADDASYLRCIARSTWRFFESQLTPENHWLPPDNVQLEPLPLVAEQTSPSNIGFALLSTAAAYDLGYTTCRETVYNLAQSLNSIDSLARYRGHLYNWYSLPGRQPLSPRYVSTVDSGNLVGAMIAVRESLVDLARSPSSPQLSLDGIADDLALLRDTLTHGRRPKRSAAAMLGIVDDIERELAANENSNEAVNAIQAIAQSHSLKLNDALLEMISTHDVDWTSREIEELRNDVRNLTRRASTSVVELSDLFPWRLRLAALADAADTDWPDELAELVHAEFAPLKPLNVLPQHIANAERTLADCLGRLAGKEASNAAWQDEAGRFLEELKHARAGVQALLDDIEDLVITLDRLIAATDFGFLYDDERQLFHVGYRVDSGEMDTSHYDLLASEARLASFIAIAKGDVPPKHWVHLGRPITTIRGLRILLSWSATAFEYLMPQLLMQGPRFGLLVQSCKGAVSQQQRFASENRIPWGISESGFHHFDQHGRYQYQAFGVPRLGFKWDQGERLVVSPYASLLALRFDAHAVIRNARRIERFGGRGEYGFYEALDFGAAHHKKRMKPAIVQSYMAHHQGMIMTSVANLLTGDRMVERFHRDTRIAKASYLLYEKLPLRAEAHALETFEAPLKRAEPVSVGIETWTTRPGEKPLAALSNGSLTARVTTLGGGNLTWQGRAMTRWLAHGDGPAGGSQLYIRDLDSDLLWSPGLAPNDPNVTLFTAPDRIEIRDARHELLIREQILVAPFADVEIRRLFVKSDGDNDRRLFICAYSEPALADVREDARHPAFSKLFVECDYLADRGALVYRRRPRHPDDATLTFACKLVTEPGTESEFQFETDRREFIGRCGTQADPYALKSASPRLRSDARDSLDPAAVLGFDVTVPAGETLQCAFLAAAGDDEVKALRDIERLDSLQRIDWTITDARRHVQHELMLLEVDSQDVRKSFELAGCLLSPARPDPDRATRMARVAEAQRSLWRHGISGDRPVITAVIDSSVSMARIESLVRVLSVCQSRAMTADVVFIDESESAYSHPIQDRLRQLIRRALRRTALNRDFQTFIVPAYNIEGRERAALGAASRLVFDLRRGDWYPQLARYLQRDPSVPAFLPQPSAQVERTPIEPVARPADLELDNGLGGIAADDRSYNIFLERDQHTPAPWCNVLANPDFGTLVSECGASNTWFQNSSEFALTTWINDAVANRSGESMYLRDEETGIYWSPTPGPARDESPYLVKHAIGETTFEHSSEGLDQRTRVFVDPGEPVKYVQLKLTNRWPRIRRITVTYAAEWRLGSNGSEPGQNLVPDWDERNDVLYVRNAFTTTLPQTCAFLTASLPAHGVTSDGEEFLGPLRSWRRPTGMNAIGLAGRTSPCAHPLGVYQVHVNIPEGESRELHFAIGAGRDKERAEALSRRARNPEAAQQALTAQQQAWSGRLDACRVETPDASLNALLNAWLPYQAVSSRLWGRLGFYQASGAFGFRDQLQDVLALLNLDPELARAHIRQAAAVQFEEGDVLHWWHDEPLRGVRTRCADDLLWLPYALARYVSVTRDTELLDHEVPFLDALPLAADQHERFADYRHGNEIGSLYEHCCRAIEARLDLGRHGLPFFGSGDWNDGLNRVGIEGAGESVWMAWFLIEVCRRFEPLCRLKKDSARVRAFRDLRKRLQKNVEESAWAGNWYLRGFYDDGTPLGGPGNDECRIDLNAQTWAVLAGQNEERKRQALESAIEHLSDDENRLIKLLAPPFHDSDQEPGYIKAYPPGVRENGGQYNHAATWAILAAAKAGNSELALRWLSFINPFDCTRTPENTERYRLEPFVVAADIYSCPPFTGQGGWSWYSGSAAWLYRVVTESLLGIERRGDRLHIRPCLPDDWQDFKVTIKHEQASYALHVHNPSRITQRQILFVENEKIITGAALKLERSGHHVIDVFPDEASMKRRRAASVA